MNAQRPLELTGAAGSAAAALLDASVPTGVEARPLYLPTGLSAIPPALGPRLGGPRTQRYVASLGVDFWVYYAVWLVYAILGAPPKFRFRVPPEGLDSLDLSAMPRGPVVWFAGYRLLHVRMVVGVATGLLVPRSTPGRAGATTLLAAFDQFVLIVSGTGSVLWRLGPLLCLPPARGRTLGWEPGPLARTVAEAQ